MRTRILTSIVAAIAFAGNSHIVAQEADPIINGNKLSELAAAFKAAKTTQERSQIAVAIGNGKEKAKSAVPLLAEALKDKDPLMRMNIAMALRSMGGAAAPAVPNLIAGLKDSDTSGPTIRAEGVRAQIAFALGAIGPEAKAAVPALSDIFKDAGQKTELRRAAAFALGSIGADAKDAMPLLTDALKDKDARIRMAAANGLYLFDKANAKIATPVFKALLKEKDEMLQTEVALVLKSMGEGANDAVPELMVVLAKGGMPAYYAREALGKIPAAEPALVAALSDSDAKLKEAAAGVLKEYYPEAAKKAGLTK